MQSILSDTAWFVWEPLIEEVRFLASSERCKMARSAI
ncbi:hypothetical protein GFGA_1c1416 [Gluconobacter frateurii NBRC 103465]|nr:hypothetical protein GFGA_1c1416 [Gluconobacter frateurii NBRC 103465]